jgi:hypothetical protein
MDLSRVEIQFTGVMKRREGIKEKIEVPVVRIGKVGIGANGRIEEGFEQVRVF